MERIPEAPPPDQLREFPRFGLETGFTVWRVHCREYGPWFFGQTGRFGVQPPHGTCYVGLDPMTAICETVIRGKRAIEESDLERRVIRSAVWPQEVSVADLMARHASKYQVSRNFGTEEPYDRTKSWAKSFLEAGYEGVRYWPRHDLQDGTVSLAIFGTTGERKSWRKGKPQRLSNRYWRERIQSELGVLVAPVPHDKDLVFASL